MRYSQGRRLTNVDRRSGRRTGATKRVPKRFPSRRVGHAERPKLPLRETLEILRVIAARRATINDLTRSVRMSRATVYRLLAGCKRDLGMRIDCESRVFKLRDWGLLNRRRVLRYERGAQRRRGAE
jgi:hypothetical protein